MRPTVWNHGPAVMNRSRLIRVFSGAACQNRTDDLLITSDRWVPGTTPHSVKIVDITGFLGST